ncbi:MAG TPA: transglutaminase family protein [Chloroflexota bacterium]|nr:transglutaminase family protein [Chloroflexota bacterium]
MIELPVLLDHRDVDWSTIRRTSYVIHQELHYQYPGPVHDLRQGLIVVPADRHGGQRLIEHRLEVGSAHAEIRSEIDCFGNRRYLLDVPVVEEAVLFSVWVRVERLIDQVAAPCNARQVRLFVQPSPLTEPDERLRAAATTLRASGVTGLELAQAIMEWVYGAMSYMPDVTGVRTTAAEALALGQGVCQDYAHIMLALCRLCGIPARYVSGHLLGEGGTHAWVEVLLPAARARGEAMAFAFDPTHNRRAGPTTITVAVGRDYRDVAPTSGTFRAPYSGRLTARKRAGIVAVEPHGGAAA